MKEGQRRPDSVLRQCERGVDMSAERLWARYGSGLPKGHTNVNAELRRYRHDCLIEA
jgi:hypothetical protein